MNYISYNFWLEEPWQKEILIAQLSDLDFQGFEERENQLIAVVSEEKFHEKNFVKIIQQVQKTFPFTYYKEIIPDQNWNDLWEKNFHPIHIGNDIIVRASFHPSITGFKHEVIIDPKMSFGTGHHETTSMMMQLMLKENFQDKTVLDFGSGTAILSILTAKLGALKILAIDNDQRAYENAGENLALNDIANVEVLWGDANQFQGKKFDVILANINRKVILNSLKDFFTVLNSNGKLLVSGFLEEDEAMILQAALSFSFEQELSLKENRWIACSFKRSIASHGTI